MDIFTISLKLADGSVRTFTTSGTKTAVEVLDPLGAAQGAPEQVHRRRHPRRHRLPGVLEKRTMKAAVLAAALLAAATLAAQSVDPGAADQAAGRRVAHLLGRLLRASATARSRRSTREREEPDARLDAAADERAGLRRCRGRGRGGGAPIIVGGEGNR